ncbi:hypothetical protein SAMN02990966_00148 [Rhodospirillales bacterium URHD0017]|nr:hypothetical protein SAMN02990966_00148 [Rhodospirillales bacterium URHD0017]
MHRRDGGLFALAAAIVGRANAADFAQLPEIISKEPLGPYLRRGGDNLRGA